MQLVKWKKGSIVLVPRALCSADRAHCVRTAGNGRQGMRQGQLGERMGRAAAHRAPRQEPRPVHDGGQRRQEVCGGREVRLPDRGGREGLGDCRGRDRPRCARAAVVPPPIASGRRPRVILRRLPASIVPDHSRRQPTPPRSVLACAAAAVVLRGTPRPADCITRTFARRALGVWDNDRRRALGAGVMTDDGQWGLG